MRSSLLFLLAAVAAGCTTTSATVDGRPGTVTPPRQDLKLAAYNVGFGAAVGGFGALFNGRDGRPLRRLARGAGRGALGGGVVYGGKWMAGQVGASESFAFGLPALLVHEAGASAIENAAYDRLPLHRLSALVGFVRLDVAPSTGAVQARLMPLNALAFVLMLREHDLALGRTLAYGTPVFIGDGLGDDPLDIAGGPSNGFAFLNTVYLNRDDADFHDTAAHELVHVMQHREYLRTAALYGRLDEPLRQWGAYRAVARWVYLDNVAMQAAVYFGVEGGAISRPCKYDNWLEREAEAFGSRRAVGICP